MIRGKKVAYTYLIGWTQNDVWYYGVRYAKDSSPEDLWSTYFTSSKYVQEYRKKIGEPDHIEVRRVFRNTKSAIDCEDRVIRTLKLYENKRFLNKSYSGSIYYDEDVRQKLSNHAKKPRSEKFKKARSETMKEMWKNGVYDDRIAQTEEHKSAVSAALKKRYSNQDHHCVRTKRSEIAKKSTSDTLKSYFETLDKTKKSDIYGKGAKKNIGKKRSDETKKRLSENAKNRKLVECEFCGKNVTSQSLGRYHKEGKCRHD